MNVYKQLSILKSGVRRREPDCFLFHLVSCWGRPRGPSFLIPYHRMSLRLTALLSSRTCRRTTRVFSTASRTVPVLVSQSGIDGPPDWKYLVDSGRLVSSFLALIGPLLRNRPTDYFPVPLALPCPVAFRAPFAFITATLPTRPVFPCRSLAEKRIVWAEMFRRSYRLNLYWTATADAILALRV